MKDVLVRAGSSIVATAVSYLVLTLAADKLGTMEKAILAGVLGLIAFVVAWWATRESAAKPTNTEGTATASGSEAAKSPGSVSVLTGLQANNARVGDVTIGTDPGQRVDVGANIDALGDVELKNVRINAREDGK